MGRAEGPPQRRRGIVLAVAAAGVLVVGYRFGVVGPDTQPKDQPPIIKLYTTGAPPPPSPDCRFPTSAPTAVPSSPEQLRAEHLNPALEALFYRITDCITDRFQYPDIDMETSTDGNVETVSIPVGKSSGKPITIKLSRGIPPAEQSLKEATMLGIEVSLGDDKIQGYTITGNNGQYTLKTSQQRTDGDGNTYAKSASLDSRKPGDSTEIVTAIKGVKGILVGLESLGQKFEILQITDPETGDKYNTCVVQEEVMRGR